MAKEQRFERVYTQGALQITEIWIDKETGAGGSGCPAPSCLQTSGGRHCA